MDIHKLTRELHTKNDTKIVMYVADGLGGLPQQPGGLLAPFMQLIKAGTS